MNRCTFRLLLRSVRRSLGRYLAILAIVALGVGFFSGLKSSCPAMLGTADAYFHRQRFEDFRLLSSLGLTEEDAAAFEALPGVAAAQGGCFADAWVDVGGGQEVLLLLTLPEKVDLPELTAGRMPENAGECLADSRLFDEEDLGRTLTVSPDNEEDTLDLLRNKDFTIVGLARSPRFISESRGDTSLGSGKIAGFVYLLPAAFDSEVCHELTLWCDLPGELYSAEYEAARDRLKSSVERLLNLRGKMRQAELRAEADEELADARDELDDGWDEYRTEKEKAERELADAQEKLDQTRRQLDDSERQIAEGSRALEEGMRQIPAARQQIAAARQQLDASAGELTAAQTQLDAGAAQLTQQEEELAAGEQALAAAKAQALAPLQQLLQAALEAEDPEEAARWEAAIAEAEAGFAPQEAALAAGREALNAARADLESQAAALNAARAELDAGYAELDARTAELDEAEAKYPARRQELDFAGGQVLNGRYEVEQAQKTLDEEKEKAERELKDAEQELLDGEAEYADAVREAAEQLELELFTLDRDANPGAVTFESDTRIIDGLANAFPLFFVLVAALVCATTMTRMVGEERTEIGTMKALGYSDGDIIRKYLLYAGSAALLGCVLGFFLGTAVIPRIVWYAYGIIYDYANLDFYFSPLLYGASLAAAVSATVLVTWLACRRELTEKPAELIRPRAPKAGKRLFLEKLPLWRRLPFLSKVSVRNAFHYPLRAAMLLLGIGGCTALMVAGFGALDSVANISDDQYGSVFFYDLAVTLDTEEPASDAAALWAGRTDRQALTWQDAVTLRFGGREKSTRAIAAQPGALEGLVSLHDKTGELPFPGPGQAVVTEKIAQVLKLSPGDALTLETEDGEQAALTVSGVCKNYLGHYVFLNAASLGAPENNTALLRVKEGEDAARLGASLRAAEGVSYVTETAEERAVMEQSMASLDLLVVLLIVCSAALAFITLFNLTNINIMERVREIATVKVLGFTPWETASYVLRENRLLSLLGALLGLGLGKGLHTVVIRAIVVDNMSIDARIRPMSYLVSFAATIVFTLLTNALMHGRLEKINMAESLKSVE